MPVKVKRIAIILVLFLSSCMPKVAHMGWQRELNAPCDIDFLFQDIVLPPHALTLDEMIAIAMNRNLDLLVKAQEYAIQEETATRERLKMIPSLIFNGELSGRNEPIIVSSKSVEPNVPPAPPSISEEQHVERYNINLVWNLLDFGLSFFRSRQEANRSIVQELEYERLQHNLALDIVKQYWKAVAARKGVENGEELLRKYRINQETLDREVALRLISNLEALRQNALVLDVLVELNAYRRDYDTSMAELALLMGLPPGIGFEIAIDDDLDTDVELWDINCLEEYAIYNRPELFSKDLEEIIVADEARAAFIQMFPGIELFAGDFFDGNFFLRHKQWLAAGARATWNLFAIPQQRANTRATLRKQELVRFNRLTLSMGVMSQVRLASLVFFDNRQQFGLAQEYYLANKNLVDAIKHQADLGKMKPVDVLSYAGEALTSQVDALKAYGEMQVALEQLNNAIGLPRYFKTSNSNKSGGNSP